MFEALIDQMLGPVGRWLADTYLANSALLSVPVAVWMAVVAAGLHGPARLRGQQRRWVLELLGEYDPADPRTPARIVERLETRWAAAGRQVRWMPTRGGWWTRRATLADLRVHTGFTPAGVQRLLTGQPQAGHGRRPRRAPTRPHAQQPAGVRLPRPGGR